MFQQRSLLPLAIVCIVLTVALFLSFQGPREQSWVAPTGLDIAKRLMNPPADRSTRQIQNVIQSNVLL